MLVFLYELMNDVTTFHKGCLSVYVYLPSFSLDIFLYKIYRWYYETRGFLLLGDGELFNLNHTFSMSLVLDNIKVDNTGLVILKMTQLTIKNKKTRKL